MPYIMRKPKSTTRYIKDETQITFHSHDVSNVGISFRFNNAGGQTDVTIVIPNSEIIDLMAFMLSALRMTEVVRNPTKEEIKKYVTSLMNKED